MRLRGELPNESTQGSVDEDGGTLRFRRGDVELVASFSEWEQDGVRPRSGVVRW